MGDRRNILDLLKERPVIGDGSYVRTLEKRGYVRCGSYTPEAVVEYPDAVKQLHKEFIRAGSDVIQTMTFYSTNGKLAISDSTKQYDCETLNQAACDLARAAAHGTNTLICGGISPTPTYARTHNEAAVKAEFQSQVDTLVKNEVDFLLGEFFGSCEEAIWAIEVMKATRKPVACTVRCGLKGDSNGLPVGACAVRMAKAGADIVGVNCQFDPTTSLEIMAVVKRALSEAGLSPYLMMQPYGFHCQDMRDDVTGGINLPENPLAMESRVLTRIDAHLYARAAHELGVRYIGGCCGFESYHIRAAAEELAEERGFRPPGADKSDPWGQNLKNSTLDSYNQKDKREYWTNLKPKCPRSIQV